MVDYIKKHPELQAILITFNFHKPKLSSYVSSMIKLLCNIFPDTYIWEHIGLVWTKCYGYIPQEIKQEQIRTNNVEFMPMVMELVKETNGGKPLTNLPTFFIDSDFERQDPSSIEEVNRLIAWSHSLKPIDIAKVRAADTRIKETIEERDIRETRTVQGDFECIRRDHYKRNKEIRYNGKITYSNWAIFNTEYFYNIINMNNIKNRSKIVTRSADICRLGVLERHKKVNEVYQRILPIKILLGKSDFGIIPTLSDLNNVKNYIDKTNVVKPETICEFREIGGANWWREPNVDWNEYHRIIAIVPEAKQPYVYENYGRASFGIGRPHHYVWGDWQGRDRFINIGNQGIKRINNERTNLYRRQLNEASAAVFPSRSFDLLIDQFNKFLI